MKLKTIILSSVLAVTAVGAFNVHINADKTKTSISLTNVEALATYEYGEDFLCSYWYAHYCIYGDFYYINVEDTRVPRS